MRRFKKLYHILLENGDLFDLFEGMTGNWEQDRKSFIQTQTDLESQGHEEYIY